jgi:hypothetical protein
LWIIERIPILESESGLLRHTNGKEPAMTFSQDDFYLSDGNEQSGFHEYGLEKPEPMYCSGPLDDEEEEDDYDLDDDDDDLEDDDLDDDELDDDDIEDDLEDDDEEFDLNDEDE